MHFLPFIVYSIMATILITGGTGMIGNALTQELIKREHKVIILTRNVKGRKTTAGVSYAEWNVEKQQIDKKAIEVADIIIHLAGANVAGIRWTQKRKKEIEESRTLSGELIVNSLNQISNKVKLVISSSAIGYYGPDQVIPNPHPFVETDPPHNDFLASTCYKWEQAILPVKNLGIRTVVFRTGIVLSSEGGAYTEFVNPVKFGVAAVLGNGRQVVSWIHIDDVVRLYLEAISNENLNGIYNAVSPHPVNNKSLMLAIARSKRKFFIPAPVPAIALKIALGEMSIEVLKSTTVSSKKIEDTGFTFLFPTIETAVENLS